MGSEMCIRDSVLPMPKQSHPKTTAITDAPPPLRSLKPCCTDGGWVWRLPSVSSSTLPYLILGSARLSAPKGGGNYREGQPMHARQQTRPGHERANIGRQAQARKRGQHGGASTQTHAARQEKIGERGWRASQREREKEREEERGRGKRRRKDQKRKPTNQHRKPSSPLDLAFLPPPKNNR